MSYGGVCVVAVFVLLSNYLLVLRWRSGWFVGGRLHDICHLPKPEPIIICQKVIFGWLLAPSCVRGR